MIRFITLTVLLLMPTPCFAEEPTKSPLISITVEEFLKLPNEFQTLYVAGAIDGMTFVSYGYALEDHDELVDCYRTKPLGEFTKEVSILAEETQNFDQNIATLVAKTAGKLCNKQDN